MLTRYRKRLLEEQSRSSVSSATELTLDRAEFSDQLDSEFVEAKEGLQRDFKTLKQRVGAADEMLIRLEHETETQLESFSSERKIEIPRKEINLENLLSKFENFGLVVGEEIKGVIDETFEVSLELASLFGSQAILSIMPSYDQEIKVTIEGLTSFFKAFFVVIATVVLVCFPDYYFNAANKVCKSSIYVFQTTLLIFVVYIALNFYLIFYSRKSKVDRLDTEQIAE
ncbi:hypothetical protein NPIL_120451 [Nephila pilipes]|uniref:Uncharacterized protein n=1 Tax=Nephila pilipes TaxID=299642 RepID=A0A8X6NL12_NEPPI|nr:hypothetical protein NPIL_120451 [Nephila pilipes]